MNTLAVIPHYNHPDTVAGVAHALRTFGLPVLIVDDGSDVACRARLETLDKEAGITVLYRECNGGKGVAMKNGFRYAEANAYSHVLQVDADAQHHLADTDKLLAAAAAAPQAVVCGWPQYGADAPKARLYGRKITDFWNGVHTWSADIKDGMCGFRVYPLAAVSALLASGETVGERMDFDTEILIRLYWRGVRPVWIKTPVVYRAGGVSHFRAWADNVLISKMHTRLFFGMLQRRFSGSVK